MQKRNTKTVKYHSLHFRFPEEGSSEYSLTLFLPTYLYLIRFVVFHVELKKRDVKSRLADENNAVWNKTCDWYKKRLSCSAATKISLRVEYMLNV
jgi:hypothetical protein